MADENTHINYSVEDIERYLEGKMSAKEMHDIEKAALHDAFLADAIEGYSSVSFEDSKKHLNEIYAALQKQKEETKVVPLKTKTFHWWRVAAVIILILGIGAMSWFIIQPNEINEVSDLAQAKENKSLNADTLRQNENGNAVVKNDASKELLAQNLPSKALKNKNKKDDLHENVRITTPQLRRSESPQQAFKKNLPDSSATEKDFTASISSLYEAKQDSTIKQAPVASEENTSMFLNKTVNTFIGRVVDTNNQPVAYATINMDNKQRVTTDINGNFKLQFPDSLVNVNVSSVGFVTANAQLKDYQMNVISIEPDKTALDEVVTTGYGIKKLSKKNADADSVYPSGGWESFQAYVYRKLNKPFDSANNRIISGDVELEFLIDDNGEPYNFSVIKSINDVSASKAIQIVKEGPKWIATSKEKKGKVTIKF